MLKNLIGEDVATVWPSSCAIQTVLEELGVVSVPKNGDPAGVRFNDADQRDGFEVSDD